MEELRLLISHGGDCICSDSCAPPNSPCLDWDLTFDTERYINDVTYIQLKPIVKTTIKGQIVGTTLTLSANASPLLYGQATLVPGTITSGAAANTQITKRTSTGAGGLTGSVYTVSISQNTAANTTFTVESPPITYYYGENMPLGTTLSNTGYFSGTVVADGYYSFKLYACNSGGCDYYEYVDELFYTAAGLIPVIDKVAWISSISYVNTYFTAKITTVPATTFKGQIANTKLTLSTDASPKAAILYTAVTAGAIVNTKITSLVSGSQGKAGSVYTVDKSQTVAAGTSITVASPAATSYSAYNLPLGVTCNATTGVISGYTTTSGVYTITLCATNAAGSACLTWLPERTVVPEWFRVNIYADKGNLASSMTMGTTYVGRYLLTHATNHIGLATNWSEKLYNACVVYDRNPCYYFATRSEWTYDCVSFNQTTGYTLESYGDTKGYMRRTGNFFDVNLKQYKIDNPTATTLTVRIIPGTWWYGTNAFGGDSITYSSLGCTSFEKYANQVVGFWGYINSYDYYDEWGNYLYTETEDNWNTTVGVKGPGWAWDTFGTQSLTSSVLTGLTSGTANIYMTSACYCGDPTTSSARFIGSISGTVLTVTNMISGSLLLGDVITGAATGTLIVIGVVAYTGTGKEGTYNLNKSQTVASQTMTVDALVLFEKSTPFIVSTLFSPANFSVGYTFTIDLRSGNYTST